MRRRLLASSRRPAGFTLLEAIIAMTVMATSMIALYAWLSTSAIALNRVQANALALEDRRSALAVIEAINPLAEPRGERRIEALTVRWAADPLTDQRVGITRANLPSAFDLRLYQVEVEILRDGRPADGFKVRRAGWVAARPFTLDDQ